MTNEELNAMIKANTSQDDMFSPGLALRKTIVQLNERLEILENAIRAHTSEEGDDFAEALFDTFDSHNKSIWLDEMNAHRKKIEALRVLVPSHRIG